MVVWRLNMQLHKKVGLCTLLALSLFTMGISIVKAVHAQGRIANTDDALYDASMEILWGYTEQNFVIMMGCAPPLSSVTKLRFTPISNISSSLKRLISTSSRGHTQESPTGLGHYKDGAYFELGVAGQTLSEVHTGNMGPSLDEPDSRSIDTGKICRTCQYAVTSNQGKQTHRQDKFTTDSV
jgi:hypothetical protein